jgi:DNA-binding winged helix-turn-helix (wHTH) protein
MSLNRDIVRFGLFEVHVASGELWKEGRRINLQDQPFRLLLVLLEKPGGVTTRDELRQKLWGETFVDFEEGFNSAVRKLRDALGDSASNPRFIETLPRRGYRFIAPVQKEKPVEPDRRPAIAGGVVLLMTATLTLYLMNRSPRTLSEITRDDMQAFLYKKAETHSQSIVAHLRSGKMPAPVRNCSYHLLSLQRRRSKGRLPGARTEGEKSIPLGAVSESGSVAQSRSTLEELQRIYDSESTCASAESTTAASTFFSGTRLAASSQKRTSAPCREHPVAAGGHHALLPWRGA